MNIERKTIMPDGPSSTETGANSVAVAPKAPVKGPELPGQSLPISVEDSRTHNQGGVLDALRRFGGIRTLPAPADVADITVQADDRRNQAENRSNTGQDIFEAMARSATDDPPPGGSSGGGGDDKPPSEGSRPDGEEENNEDRERESTVPGLTREEVDLLLANGETLENIRNAQQHMDPQLFRQEADRRLVEVRRQQEEESLTPEERAEKQIKERADRLKDLEAEWQEIQDRSADNALERRLKALKGERNREEYKALRKQASEAGDPGFGADADGEGNGPPEQPRTTEGEQESPELDSLEVEASPERGLEIAREIIEQEAYIKSGQLEKVNWVRLAELNIEQKIHIEAQRLVYTRDKIHEEDFGRDQRESTEEGLSLVRTELFKDSEGNEFRPLSEWMREYNRGGMANIQDKERFKKEITVYLAEAKRVGLLDDLDRVLSSAWGTVKSEIASEQNSEDKKKSKHKSSEIMPLVNREIQAALQAASDIHLDRAWVDEEGMSHLVGDYDEREVRMTGIWDLYARLARERFTAAINNVDPEGTSQREYLRDSDGNIQEFNLSLEEDEEDSRETYWRPSASGWYLEIYAQNEEQFSIAAETYINRLQLLSSAPDKMLQDASQFVDQIVKSNGAKKVSDTFLRDLIRGIDGRLGAYGADESSEQYHGQYYKQYLDYVNKNGEGPNKWLQLAKSMDGRVAAALWLLDNDPRWDTIFTMYGARGGLADASFAQRTRDGSGLHFQALDLLIEEMVGIEIKNMDNIGNLTKFTSQESFANNFNGLYRYGSVPKEHHGDAHLQVYETYKDRYEKEGEKAIPAHRKRSFRLGRIQHEIEQITEMIRNGEAKTLKTHNGKSYDPLKHHAYDLLKNSADIKFYKHELEKAEKAVHIALQIYGTFGEKSKRGGGVFKTDTKVGPDGKEYQYFVPIHMGEKFVQTAVTLTKMEYADDAEIWKRSEFAKHITKKLPNGKENPNYIPNFRAKYRTARVKDAMHLAIGNFKKDGYEAILEEYDYDASGNRVEGTRRQMTLKKPKEDSKTGEVVIENGKRVIENAPIDFYLATHHPYADWSGHTYWSYQEEHRHLLLSPATLLKAREFRAGKITVAEAGMAALQLLILDPTLKRVRKFTKNFEDRERKLTMGAIEDSYQTHKEISIELHRPFFPEFGTPTEQIGVYYGLQDFGGFRKMHESMRARVAEDPDRFMRRGRRLWADLDNPIFPYAEYLGRGTGGALAIMDMMDAPVYRGAGAFALDKFAAQVEIASKIHDALFNSQDGNEAEIIEGLLLKLTNDGDINLQPFEKRLPIIRDKLGRDKLDPPRAVWDKSQVEFLSAIRKSFGRLEKYLKKLVVMESLVRNATGAFDLKNVDILLEGINAEGEVENIDTVLESALSQLPEIVNLTEKDQSKKDLSRDDLAKIITGVEEALRETEGQYNESFNKGEIDESKSPNTGTGRRSARRFYDTFIKLMLDRQKRGGEENYPGERIFIRHMNDKIVYYDPTDPRASNNGWVQTDQTIADWLFGKMVAT